MDKFNINLEDLLTCNPISKRGIDALNRVKNELNISMSMNDFFAEGIYTEPYFMNDSISEFAFNLDSSREEFEYYNINAFSVKGSAIRNMRINKVYYERKFFSKDSSKILLIRAASGSGKTTYLNYLIWERRKKYYPQTINQKIKFGELNDAFELNFDLERAVSKVNMGGIIFPNEEFYNKTGLKQGISSAPCSFLCMLVQSIVDTIYEIALNNNIAFKNKIRKNFRKIYNNNYSNKVKALFDLMLYKSFYITNKRKFCEQILSKTIDVCLEFGNCIKDFIGNALKILTRVLACNLDLDNPNQILIDFDNIEHYIEIDKRIYDEDIRLISDSIYNFVSEEDNYYGKIGLKFAKYFKFVLVIRDTTEKMLSGNVHSYFLLHNDNSIDVTNWFSPNRIYFNKIKYFHLNDAGITEIDFFNLITNDSANTTGENVMQQISSMYNHNNRRTARILSRISNIFTQIENEPDKNEACLNYSQFKQLWTEFNTNHVKFLCRQSIIRLIYNEISRTGYFRNIYGTIVKYNEKSTYARRILTWLVNNKNFEQEDYVSFHIIVNEILKCPDVNGVNLDKEKIKDFAKVLMVLDEHRFTVPREDVFNSSFGANRWCQLIVIKYNDPNLSTNLDAETLSDKLYEESGNVYDADNFGVKITEAGYYFVRALRDFEFFACRYDDNSTPLIFMKDVNEIKKTIRNVFLSAKDCIDNAISNESSFFNKHFIDSDQFDLLHISNEKKVKFQSLPLRIIIQHRGYLQSYKYYIDDDELHLKFKVFTGEQRKIISAYVQEYLDKYEEIFYDIKKSVYKINGEVISNYFHKKTDRLV